jgi:hypothetical protein
MGAKLDNSQDLRNLVESMPRRFRWQDVIEKKGNHPKYWTHELYKQS